ncbi:MAG: septum formation initiator family protein [Desulfatiglans sp.]|jgi:cell division protein FtsB|nr:septum formation initiator family protein [Thermodesulfobacteriota bacterium]MEE4354585.1 septum formation initiator family protein [Desulfatiglans sp.]
MKAKTLKFLVMTLCFIGAIITWLAFGERGLIQLYHVKDQREDLVRRIDELNKENHALLQEVHRLRHDKGYIESVARKQLNLIKSDEIMYIFKKTEIHNPDGSDVFEGTGQTGESKKPERKVGLHDENR